MITFKEYVLIEQVVLPKPGKKLGFNRKEMPQITKDMHRSFFAYLKKKGVSTKSEKVDPSELKPSQVDFSKKKIRGMMSNMETGSYVPKRILVSKDNYVIDGHHTWIAHMNLDWDIPIVRVDVAAKTLFDLMHEYPKSYTKKLHENLNENECALVGMKQIKQFEKIVDALFDKFGIDFNFTRHFADRMGDDRNTPCITMKELATFIKKIYARQGKSLKGVAGAESVIKDMQSNLNIPIAVTYDSRNDEFDVAMKTIMRKKNFRTSNKIIRY
jgi:hypothetical protein